MENFEKELLNEEELAIFNGLDESKKKEIEARVQAVDAEFQALVERANQFEIVHEDIILIEKLDIASVRSTRIHAATSQADTRVRMGYYGRVLAVSSKYPSDDELQERKKKDLKIGDIITFNPDAAYSLNVIIPKNEPSIWLLSVLNIMAIDRAFNMEQCLKKRAICEILYEEERKQREQHLAGVEKKAGPLSNIIPANFPLPTFRKK